MTTIATLFSGGEGVGCGARAAGLTHLWGIEYDSDIAAVARDNGFNVLTADVLDIDPHQMERPDLLHASPTCTRASVANSSGSEDQLDIDTATKTAQFIDVLRPDYFTLENVYPYRKFESFGIILAALQRNGYWFNFEHLNSADFGVPQTRRRLILWASRVGLLPMMPPPVPWVGWYEAIVDLIPTLPESQFAPWQLARLPEELVDSFVMWSRNTNFTDAYPGKDNRLAGQPTNTIMAGIDRLNPCAFIVDGDGNRSRSPTVISDKSPSMTITAWHGRRPIQMPRAHISTPEAREEFEYQERLRWANERNERRARLSQGRVVKMTPRALARFQSFPDDYQLPDSNRLAVEVIGNAVPPLMYQRIAEALTR